MIISEPNRTQFDLSWRMFGIPVRIHPMFWLVGIIFGWSWAQAYGLTYLAVWVLCMLISILVHELGHVFMGRIFGAYSHIVLYGFGGLAVGSLQVRGPWRRIAVLLAGPGAGFLLFGLVVLIGRTAGASLLSSLEGQEARRLVLVTFDFLFYMNLVWNLLNLLPIWPLDGGQICGELLIWKMGEKGLKVALVFSIVVAGLIALRAFLPQVIPVNVPRLLDERPQPYLGIVFLLIAAENVQMLTQLNNSRGGWE